MLVSSIDIRILQTCTRCCTVKLIWLLISLLACVISWYNQFHGTTDGWNLVSSSSPQPASSCKWLFSGSAGIVWFGTDWACSVTFKDARRTLTRVEISHDVMSFHKHLTVLRQIHGGTTKHFGRTEIVTYCSTDAGVCEPPCWTNNSPKCQPLASFPSPADLTVIPD